MKALRIKQSMGGSYNTSTIRTSKKSFIIKNDFDIYFTEDNTSEAIKELYSRNRMLYANNTTYKTERGAINAIKKILKTRG